MFSHNKKALLHFMLLASMIVGIAMADSSTDKQECTEQLTGLATCLPYIQGESKAPPPDCCSGLKQVLKQNKKCLCLIIKDRNDPDLGGLMINVTSALSLPTVCNAPANISKCPELLHMDPKSKEAQVFYQLNKGSNNSGPSPAPSTSVGGSAARSQTTTATQKNDAMCKEKRLFGFDNLAAGLLVWLLFSFSSMV
ncbi:non-specific lipid transfer protein GPI-anchored 14-like isoform X2 [Lotus japonicus]|uniref:non-specific lipid transfer protein GPI-anchored 14-like isoform X2 n=1 Tax=Lotus japonicus TaxID=34305 RepID=UPI00258547F9|nr:non-specific lipid transfer protein GPI-anchored 14-like isoform X2 [Lotus japonicus]